MSTEAATVVWEDPPSTKSGPRRRIWAERLAPLRGRPGAWARIVSEKPDGLWGQGVMSHLKNGSTPGVNPSEYEFCIRSTSASAPRSGEVPSRFALYARFIEPELSIPPEVIPPAARERFTEFQRPSWTETSGRAAADLARQEGR